MFLIWRGWGILVAAIVPLSFLLALLLVEKFPFETAQATGYLLGYNSLILFFGGVISAALIFALISAVKSKYGEAAEARGDALFFVPLQIWFWLSAAIAVCGIAYGLLGFN
jgi:hypothetical protein